MIWLPIVCTGLNEVIGSWKISAISPPRIARISAPVGVERARSTSVDCRVPSPPAGAAGSGRSTIRPGRVDDAQDRARGDALAAAALADDAQRLPGETSKLAPSTALHHALVQEEVGLQIATDSVRGPSERTGTGALVAASISTLAPDIAVMSGRGRPRRAGRRRGS